jgi:D-3-phosphoglycerate dehydrogenase
MPKVLISDKLSPAAVEIFRRRGIDVDLKPGLSPADLRAIIASYDGLAVRSATKVTRELLDVATNLKVVGRAGIGVDNVDVRSATARGVVVMNTPHGNTITTAEHAIAMMFALARQIPEASASTKAGKWEKNRFMGVELTGKTLGLVGCGNIGSIVADRAIGLKMRVVAYDPFLNEKRAMELGVEKVEFDDLLARADIITLHTPLTDATRNLISREALAKTQRGVRIINCARGGLVDELALAEAIQAGHVAGAALDVFEIEPATQSPLFGLENVVCTPHLGAATAEAQENVALQVAEQMSDFLLTGAVANAINMPSVSAEDAPRLKPYMELCRLLGAFAGQLTHAREGVIRRVLIEYEGQVAALNTRPLTAAALAGLMTPITASMLPRPCMIDRANTKPWCALPWKPISSRVPSPARCSPDRVPASWRSRVSASRPTSRRTCSTSPIRTSQVSSVVSVRRWRVRGSTSQRSIWAGRARAAMRSAWCRSMRTCRRRCCRWCGRCRLSFRQHRWRSERWQ